MKTVVNKIPKPVRVPLPRGKVLHLGPLKSGQISPEASEHEPVKKLVEAGTIEIQEASQTGRHDHLQSTGPHESTSGAPTRGILQGRGDR